MNVVCGHLVRSWLEVGLNRCSIEEMAPISLQLFNERPTAHGWCSPALCAALLSLAQAIAAVAMLAGDVTPCAFERNDALLIHCSLLLLSVGGEVVLGACPTQRTHITVLVSLIPTMLVKSFLTMSRVYTTVLHEALNS